MHLIRSIENWKWKINRNMRCIEMVMMQYQPIMNRLINRNMRCIEMRVFITPKADAVTD